MAASKDPRAQPNPVDKRAVRGMSERVCPPNSPSHVPAGLIVHFAYPVGDAVRIIDVWADEQSHDTFDDLNDPPRVLAGVLADRGLQPPRLISREVADIQALVSPVS